MSVCTSFNAIPFLTHKMLHHGGLVPGTWERRRGAIGHAVAASGFFSTEVNSGEARNLSWG